jgi:hypothetical protein
MKRFFKKILGEIGIDLPQGETVDFLDTIADPFGIIDDTAEFFGLADEKGDNNENL